MKKFLYIVGGAAAAYLVYRTYSDYKRLKDKQAESVKTTGVEYTPSDFSTSEFIADAGVNPMLVEATVTADTNVSKAAYVSANGDIVYSDDKGQVFSADGSEDMSDDKSMKLPAGSRVRGYLTKDEKNIIVFVKGSGFYPLPVDKTVEYANYKVTSTITPSTHDIKVVEGKKPFTGVTTRNFSNSVTSIPSGSSVSGSVVSFSKKPTATATGEVSGDGVLVVVSPSSSYVVPMMFFEDVKGESQRGKHAFLKSIVGNMQSLIKEAKTRLNAKTSGDEKAS